MPEDKDKQKTISNIVSDEEEFRGGKLKLSKDEKERIAKQIMEEIGESLTAYQTQLKSLEQYEDLTDMKVEPRSFPFENCSNICYPIIWTKIRTFVARAMRIMMGPESPFMVKGGSKDEVHKAPKVQYFLNWVVKVEAQLKRTFRRCFRKVGRVGTCILKPYWVKEVEIVRDIEEYDDLSTFKRDFPSAEKAGVSATRYKSLINKLNKKEKIEITTEYEDIKYEGLKVDIIDRKDFIVPFGVIDSQDCLFNYQRLRRRWFELKNDEASGMYEDVEQLLPNQEFDLDSDDNLNERIEDNKMFRLYTGIRKYQAFKNNKDVSETLRNKFVDCVFTIGIKGGTTTALGEDIENDLENATPVYLKGEIQPYFHNHRFFIPVRMEEGDGFDGIGLAQKLYDLNLEINFYHNAEVDGLLLSTALAFKARRGSSVESEDQHFYPGVIFWVDQMQDIEQFDIQPSRGNLPVHQSMLMRQCELHSGITDYSSGKESPTDPRAPAAKAMMLLQETNISINEYIDCMRESMSELAYQIIGLYFQFMPKDKMYQVLGKDGDIEIKKVSRQDLRMKRAEYIVTGSTAEENKYLERQEFRELVGFAMGFPEIKENPDARRELLSRLFDKYDEKGKETIIPTKEDVKKAQIQMAREAMKEEIESRMGAMAGEGGGGRRPPPSRPENIQGMGGLL